MKRESRDRWIIVGLSVANIVGLVAIGSVLTLYRGMQGLTTVSMRPTEVRQALQLTRDVPADTTLLPGDVRAMPVDMQWWPPVPFTTSIDGRATERPLLAGELLRDEALGPAFPTAVPKGHRAMRMPMKGKGPSDVLLEVEDLPGCALVRGASSKAGRDGHGLVFLKPEALRQVLRATVYGSVRAVPTGGERADCVAQ